MSVIEILKDLIEEYKYEITKYKCGFFRLNSAWKIQFKEERVEELFQSLLTSISKVFGMPEYVHSYYGLIWNKDGKYISCNIIEGKYCCGFIDVFVFDKMPFGKKLTYNKYSLIDGGIKQVFDECGFVCNSLLNYNQNGFAYFVVNEDKQWLLQIRGRKMTCYFLDITVIDAETKRATPRYLCKKIVNPNNTESIKNAIRQCFLEKNNNKV